MGMLICWAFVWSISAIRWLSGDISTQVVVRSQSQLFEQYVRNSVQGHASGSGLGLHLCSVIARLHGGDLTYRTLQEGGASFAMRLPRN